MIITEGEHREIIIPAAQETEFLQLERGAQVRVLIEGNSRLRLDAHLAGEGARLDVQGTYLGRGSHSQDVALCVIQDAKATICNIRFRATLEDSARSRFDGLIRMTERAINASASLSYRALLVSKHASAVPIPRLEVLTKQVMRASHEAAVGTIDPHQLFYMQTRGLCLADAKQLLIKGFLGI
ncbi:MAG: SufD family Fe-S cluster assembly protein [Candidatus Sungbacteria bacterium]|nr:SufD family Fe-S cluster assembly protein [bacterium]MDZ4260380.1 SufD family Fe-S cluster assembly protein [Candidatus Sungbacteria bacterium]